jgi:hypothetical protein
VLPGGGRNKASTNQPGLDGVVHIPTTTTTRQRSVAKYSGSIYEKRDKERKKKVLSFLPNLSTSLYFHSKDLVSLSTRATSSAV